MGKSESAHAIFRIDLVKMGVSQAWITHPLSELTHLQQLYIEKQGLVDVAVVLEHKVQSPLAGKRAWHGADGFEGLRAVPLIGVAQGSYKKPQHQTHTQDPKRNTLNLDVVGLYQSELARLHGGRASSRHAPKLVHVQVARALKSAPSWC